MPIFIFARLLSPEMLIKFLCEAIYQKVAGNQGENLGSGSFSMENCKGIRKFLDDLFI